MHGLLLIGLGCTPHVPPHASIELSERTVRFDGRSWSLRASEAPTGAGPSRWSDAGEAVTVFDGRMCLSLTEGADGWYGAEVLTPWPRRRPAVVELEPLPFALDDVPELVVGVFLYRTDQDELDAEWSAWGEPGAPAFQFVAAPAAPERRWRFEEVPERVELRWRRRGPVFRADGGPALRPEVPLEGRGRWFLHINVWTVGGAAPSTSGPVQVCVDSVD